MTDEADQSADIGDSGAVLALLGVNGWVIGECHALGAGDDIVIGRSRSCDISLRRSPQYLSKSRYDRDNDHDFNTVSRRHVHLTVMEADSVRVEDLSTNGTYVDDVLISDALDINPRESSVNIRLGTRECYQVKLLSDDEFQAKRHEHEQHLQDCAHKAKAPAGDNEAEPESVDGPTLEPGEVPLADIVEDEAHDQTEKAD
jgi:hypothetical protein